MNAEDLPVRRLGALMGVFYTVMAVLVFPLTGRAEMPTAPTDGTTEGSVFYSYSFGGGSGRTIQNLYQDSELLGLKPGDVITGISFRLNDSVSGFTGATFTRFDIAMGRGNDTLGATFADNFASPPITVRSGALTIAAADFEDGQSPNPFGKVLKFTTPYEYTGGNLIVEIRASTGTLNLDTFSDTDGILGTAAGDTDPDATTGSVDSFNLAVAFEITQDGKTPAEIVIPAEATMEGSIATDLAISSAGRTVLNHFVEDDLGGLKAGDQITGFCLRWDGSGTNPTFLPGVTFGRFDVRLGRASGSDSTLFANQFAGPPSLVREGSMTVMFPVSVSDPMPFGAFVRFDTPYTYKGGDLVVEKRFSDPVTRIEGSVVIDQLFVSTGGRKFFSNDQDATVIANDNTGINWPLQLKTCPDAKKPGVSFRGNAKKKPGSRPTRVKGVASDEGAVKMILFRASTGDKKTLSVNRANAPFVFKFRNRKLKPRVRVKIIAIDLRGNRKVGKRVYR